MLWGLLLRAWSDAFSDDEVVSPHAMVTGARLALDGVTRLGRARLGDKTLVDALVPFVETLERESAAGRTAAGGMAGCCAAAEIRSRCDIVACTQTRSRPAPGRAQHRPPGPRRDVAGPVRRNRRFIPQKVFGAAIAALRTEPVRAEGTAMERYWVGTSWKMHKTLAEGLAFAETLAAFLPSLDTRIQPFVIPSFTSVREVKRELASTRTKVGAQNMHWADEGAWTGEISPVMLRDCGLDLVSGTASGAAISAKRTIPLD